jgi:hypothetical protein
MLYKKEFRRQRHYGSHIFTSTARHKAGPALRQSSDPSMRLSSLNMQQPSRRNNRTYKRINHFSAYRCLGSASSISLPPKFMASIWHLGRCSCAHAVRLNAVVISSFGVIIQRDDEAEENFPTPTGGTDGYKAGQLLQRLELYLNVHTIYICNADVKRFGFSALYVPGCPGY